MPYCEPEEVLAQLPAFSAEDETHLAAAAKSIAEADGIIDITLSPVATTPFDPVPDKIKTISKIYARGIFLQDTWSGNGKKGNPQLATELIDRAEKLLAILVGNPAAISDEVATGSNLPIYSNTNSNRKKPILRDFDLASPFIPDLHTQLGGIPAAAVLLPMDRSNDSSSIYGLTFPWSIE